MSLLHSLRASAAFAVAIASLASGAAAQAPSSGVVRGRVTARPDSGDARPVAGASVSVSGNLAVAVTDADGRFLLERIAVGASTLHVRRLGFRGADRAIRVRAGDTLVVDIVLRHEAQRLAEVRTAARPLDAETFVTKPNIATVTMSSAAMAGVPRIGEADVMRVVQLLPGVSARNDYNTGLNVRGGDADQNLILLDGYPIYNPVHFGSLFSTFMDATVGGIELTTGAFPARFGGRLSSVLDVRSAEDARTGTHASADVSALASTARVGGAFSHGRGTWAVAARRTYADALATVFTSNIFPYHFQDFHAHGSYALPGNARVAITAYGGRDVLDANLAAFDSDSLPSKASAGHWGFDWGNQVVGATYAKEVGAQTTLEQRVSTSAFSTNLDLGTGTSTQRSAVRDWRLAGSLVRRGAAHDASIGYDVATHRIEYSAGSSQTGVNTFDLVRRPTSAALWASDLWRVSSRVLLEGGLRAEALRGGAEWTSLSPRASVKFLASPSLAFTAGVGRVAQFLQSLAGDGPLRYFDIWLASDSLTPVSLAWHYVAGVERRFGDAGSIRVEGYYKKFQREQDANWSEDPSKPGDEFTSADGRSYGVDVLARFQRASGLAGWISYSFGNSERWTDFERWAPGYDRRHDLNVVATRPMGRYRLGARFGFATGTPFTPIVGEIARRLYDPSQDTWGTGNAKTLLETIGGTRNSQRYPVTHRLDLDISREMRRGDVTYAPYLSLANAYNAQNVFVYRYDYSNDHPTRRAISQFPILPSVGMRVSF